MKSDFGLVVLIGGCGFLGHHIVSQLLELENSVQVTVVDLRTTQNRFPSVSYYDGDITDRATVLSVFQEVRPRVIIHTASPVVASFEGRSTLYYRVNVDGTRNLLECAGQVGGVKAFVYTSSASVIHDGVSDLVMADETHPMLGTPQQSEISFTPKASLTSWFWRPTRKNDGAFLITNDDPYSFSTYAGPAWAAAGDKTDPKDVWVIPKNVCLMMATILEWVFWLLFWGRKQPGTTRQKVKFSCMTRTYSIKKAKSRLGYKTLWGMKEGIIRGVESFQKQRAKAKEDREL